MSKHILVRELKQEIDKLNTVIDLKIIRGISYRAESRRHKFLMSQLSSLSQRPVVSKGWIDRMSHLVSTFMF